MVEDLRDKLKEVDEEVVKRVEGLAGHVEDKLGVSGSEVRDDFLKELKSLKDRYPDRDKETLFHQSLVRLKGKWQSELKSDAPVLEGIIKGAGDCYDPFSRRREECLEKKNEDFKKAVKEGYINKDGEPLDEEGETLPKNAYRRQVTGRFRETGESGEPKKFWMTLRGSNAKNVDIPVMEPVRFRASIADLDEGVGRPGYEYLNPTRNLTFERIESDDLTPDNLIESDDVQDETVPLHKIREIHDSQLGYGNRHATKGDVMFVATEPNESTGNMRFTITSNELEETVGDDEADNYTVWVPEHLHDKMTFQPGSLVWVYGEIRENTFNEQKTYSIQAWGIHPIIEVEDTEQEYNLTIDEEFEEATEIY